MPQLSARQIEPFLEELKANGIVIEPRTVDVDRLVPSQAELVTKKVQQKAQKLAVDSLKLKPFIVSLDGYIIDSHHQLAAVKAVRPGSLVEIRFVHLPLVELIDRAMSFLALRSKKLAPEKTKSADATPKRTGKDSGPR